MKSLILPLIFFLNFSFLAQPILKLDTNFRNIGLINYAENLEITFGFINDGNEPLIITRVSGDGGAFMCSSYPREPIMPGKRGEIKFKYDTKRIGGFSKNGNITSNSYPSNIIVLKIKGEVIPNPIASFENRDLNFNNEFNGEVNSFKLSNTGTNLLIIKKIEQVDHVFKLHPEKDTIQIGETVNLSFKLFSYLKNEDFHYSWKIFTNAPDSIITLTAKGKLNFSPLIFYEDTITKPNGIRTKFINVECYNVSNDTIIVDRVSFSLAQEGEQIWLPGKEIYWSEGKEYTIPPFKKIKVLIAYNSNQSTPSKREVIFSSKNNLSVNRYFNYLLVNL